MHYGLLAGTANSALDALQTIHMAIVAAKIAILQMFPRAGHPGFEFT